MYRVKVNKPLNTAVLMNKVKMLFGNGLRILYVSSKICMESNITIDCVKLNLGAIAVRVNIVSECYYRNLCGTFFTIVYIVFSTCI